MMTKVELHPAVLVNCDFCSDEHWQLCTMRTGMEAMAQLLGNMERAVEADRFVQYIRKRCHESNQRCPPLPNFRSAVMIHARLSCKTCGNGVSSFRKGYNFACDDCGRDNYFLPETAPTEVRCQHCGSRFKAIHFFNRGDDDDE